LLPLNDMWFLHAIALPTTNVALEYTLHVCHADTAHTLGIPACYVCAQLLLLLLLPLLLPCCSFAAATVTVTERQTIPAGALLPQNHTWEVVTLLDADSSDVQCSYCDCNYVSAAAPVVLLPLLLPLPLLLLPQLLLLLLLTPPVLLLLLLLLLLLPPAPQPPLLLLVNSSTAVLQLQLRLCTTLS
jgi:hypothetical protein